MQRLKWSDNYIFDTLVEKHFTMCQSKPEMLFVVSFPNKHTGQTTTTTTTTMTTHTHTHTHRMFSSSLVWKYQNIESNLFICTSINLTKIFTLLFAVKNNNNCRRLQTINIANTIIPYKSRYLSKKLICHFCSWKKRFWFDFISWLYYCPYSNITFNKVDNK